MNARPEMIHKQDPDGADLRGPDHMGWARRELSPVEPMAAPAAGLVLAYDVRGERVRGLATELILRRRPGPGAEIIALVSPCAGEGRSRLAAELAMAIAQTGRRTLLLDADLRCPRQHVLFDTHDRDGLAQAIAAGRAPDPRHIQGPPELSVVTTGAAPDNPLAVLSGQRFAAVLDGWRKVYDFIIVDTAPVGRFSDALVVASVAGSVLALSRARHTPQRAMRDMVARLAPTRARILGAVISHF